WASSTKTRSYCSGTHPFTCGSQIISSNPILYWPFNLRGVTLENSIARYTISVKSVLLRPCVGIPKSQHTFSISSCVPANIVLDIFVDKTSESINLSTSCVCGNISANKLDRAESSVSIECLPYKL